MAKGKRRGSVRWREDTGKYVIDYYDNLGKRHVETIGANCRAANDVLDEKMNQIRNGTFNAARGQTLFRDFAERWYKNKVSVKPATLLSYRVILDVHLIPYFGDAKISSIMRANIQDFVSSKVKEDQRSRVKPNSRISGKKLSPKSLRGILVILHQILKEAEAAEEIVKNPYVKIERPAIVSEEQEYLKLSEIPLYLNASEGQRYPISYTFIFSGMRRGELFGLEWSDIDWAGSKIHVRRSLWKGIKQNPKSRYSKREIDAGPGLLGVLKAHRAKQNTIRLKAGTNWQDNDFVFCRDDGSPMDPDNYYHRDHKAILKKAGLRWMPVHSLRHTFASVLIAAGHNPKYIQRQMGHGSIKITMDLYGHLMPEAHIDAGKKAENLVFGNVAVTESEKSVTGENATL